MNKEYTKAAIAIAKDKYQTNKDSTTFQQIVQSTSLKPTNNAKDRAEIFSSDTPQPSKIRRLGLMNTINDTDYHTLGLYRNAPALTPLINQDNLRQVEALKTTTALYGTVDKLQTIVENDLTQLTTEEISCIFQDDIISGTPCLDENPTPSSSASSNSTNSTTSSSTDESTSSKSTTSAVCQTFTVPKQSIGTNTDNETTTHATQTSNRYLPSNGLLRPGSYRAPRNFLRSLITIMNEIDTNLTIDFSYLVNLN